uniref:NADH-ubiquinone oxidoreductase chain 1 n=1 Tax=Sabella spallanzanii TaxID=85702 RepID=A0A7T1SSK0_SABSP|nr:NADH dehydrogenase subunit 1 [Sabella spallanzanii]QPO99970.1 NADH dehydrogenase subunit 1 [Sabella spallanzanii]
MAQTMTNMLLALIFGLIAMALFTLLERRGLGLAQLRKGPNKAAIAALLLPLADALKLFSKASSPTMLLNKIPFTVAPFFALTCSILLWMMLPLFHPNFPIKNSLVLILAISSLHVYAMLGMSWSSNSKYASIGMTRGLAQTISYEVSMALILIALLLPLKSLNLELVNSNGFSLMIALPLIMPIWFMTCVAETHRTPFDIAEGESELVSGFNTEYLGGKFAVIFMSEYLGILVMSTLTVMPNSSLMINNSSLMIKIVLMSLISMMFIAIRATLPRMRYDTLMWLAWGMILPMALTICIYVFPMLTWQN